MFLRDLKSYEHYQTVVVVDLKLDYCNQWQINEIYKLYDVNASLLKTVNLVDFFTCLHVATPMLSLSTPVGFVSVSSYLCLITNL